MPVHSKLEKFEDNWQTSIGWSPEGMAVLRGKDIFTELNSRPGWSTCYMRQRVGNHQNSPID